MTTQRFALVLMTLTLGGHLQATEPTADRLEPPSGHVQMVLDRNRVFEVLFQRLGGAILPPYPPSPVIAGIEWAPLETIVRRAKGSDNFPLTWSDDDALYTTYGDGLGFEPFVATKLSLGLARITGPPEGFRGVNLRSDSIEQYGEGRKGRKGWGLLSVEGVL